MVRYLQRGHISTLPQTSHSCTVPSPPADALPSTVSVPSRLLLCQLITVSSRTLLAASRACRRRRWPLREAAPPAHWSACRPTHPSGGPAQPVPGRPARPRSRPVDGQRSAGRMRGTQEPVTCRDQRHRPAAVRDTQEPVTCGISGTVQQRSGVHRNQSPAGSVAQTSSGQGYTGTSHLQDQWHRPSAVRGTQEPVTCRISGTDHQRSGVHRNQSPAGSVAQTSSGQGYTGTSHLRDQWHIPAAVRDIQEPAT